MKQKILIVEDDTALLKLLKTKFADEGYEVFGAKDGGEGLTMALSELPNLILLDIVLPVMDGLTVLSRLKINSKTRDIPVILLTNLDVAENVAMAMKEQTFDYLVKADWHIDDVVKKVKDKLHSKV